MPRWQALRAAIAGAAALAAAGLLAAAAIVHFGWFDVAASSAHLPPVRWLVHRVMIRSVKERAGDYAPAKVPAAAAAGGLCIYRRHCQACHGGPATARADWASGLNPPPPYLLDARARWSPSELHWIVEHGVKMTGMPAWKGTLNDRELWALVAFLETMPDLPPTAYKAWADAGACPNGTEYVALLGRRPLVTPPPAAARGWPVLPPTPAARR